jgi:glycosyltransferase involved in cell wall biosynthesis
LAAKLKIAYVYEYDAADPAIQSTRPFSIRRELKNQFDVRDYFPIANISRRVLAPKKLFYALSGQDHHLEREWLSLKEYAWRVGKRLASERPDIVFSPSQLIPTYLRTPARIIFCNDAPFGAIANYYPNFSDLSAEYTRQGYRQEHRAHKNAFRAVYPSAWARDCAIRLHGADPEKCMEQAFGANLPYELAWQDIAQAVKNRVAVKSIAIVLVSSDWKRKGGPFALSVVRALRDKGIDAILRVIGAAPKGLENVESLGRIDKWTDPGALKFRRAMLGGNFIIMPSVAEAYGMALWEGAAHGLPMVGRATGGIPSIIRDRETGLLFPDTATPASVADWIENASRSEEYRRLSENAFADHRRRGNWQSFVRQVFDL